MLTVKVASDSII